LETGTKSTFITNLEKQIGEFNFRACQAIEQGEMEQAYSQLQHIMTVFSTVDMSRHKLPLSLQKSRAHLLTNTGVVAARLKRFPQSRQAFGQARLLFENLGDTEQVAMQSGNLGSVCRDTGDFEQAIKCYEHAATLLNESSGDEILLADQWSNLAFSYAQLKDHTRATDFFERALAVYRRAGNTDKAQLAESNIANLKSQLS
jgi:tetratricopeptide (TPR) repeat protein